MVILAKLASSVSGSTMTEIQRQLRDCIRKATTAFCAVMFIVIILSGVGLALLNVKGSGDIRDENRAGRETLLSEIQAFHIKTNDEARAEREAWQSEIHALLVKANNEARADREAFQSEVRKFFWMTLVLIVASIAFGIFSVARIRKLERRISELKQNPDDSLPAPVKKNRQLRIVAGADSQAARRIDANPPVCQQKAR